MPHFGGTVSRMLAMYWLHSKITVKWACPTSRRSAAFGSLPVFMRSEYLILLRMDTYRV